MQNQAKKAKKQKGNKEAGKDDGGQAKQKQGNQAAKKQKRQLKFALQSPFFTYYETIPSKVCKDLTFIGHQNNIAGDQMTNLMDNKKSSGPLVSTIEAII